MAPLLDRSNIYIGAKRLSRMVSFKPDDATVREGFIPVGSQLVVGTTEKPGEKTLEIEEKPSTVDDVDWRAKKKSGEEFTVTIQYASGEVAGRREQARAQVSEFKPPEGNGEGAYTQTVKLIIIGDWIKLS